MSNNLDDKFMSIKQFFLRSLGSWESHRTYMYKSGKTISSVTNFEWTSQNEESTLYKVSWNNAEMNSSGDMIINIKDAFTLERNVGYFSTTPTISSIQQVSENFLRTLTTYGGRTYDEEMSFANENRRLRRTIGYAQGNPEDIILIGTYVEKRL